MVNEPGRVGLSHLRVLSDALAEFCTAQSREDIIRIAAQLARRLCDTDTVSLVLRTGEQLHHTAATEAWAGHSNIVASIATCVFQNRQLAVIPDARQDERTRVLAKGDTRARSFVGLPLGVPLGSAALVLSRNEEHWPDAEELLVIELVARATGLALQWQLNADLSVPDHHRGSVREWLESRADETLTGSERKQALVDVSMRHRVRNVLSLVRTTMLLKGNVLCGELLPEKSALIHGELSGRLVLLVEDDYFIAEEVSRILRDAGAQVIGPAVGTDQARALMDRQPLDCAVLDVNLRGEHVFALAHELRARSVPLVFATGYDRDVLPDVFRDSSYLQKPFDPAALIHAVRGNLGHRHVRHN